MQSFACSKIGAIHTTIFSGLSAQALRSRLNDAGAKMLITANKMQRRSISIDLRKQWMPLLKNTDISKIIVVEENEELEKNRSLELGGSSRVFNYKNFVRNSRLQGEQCKTESMDPEVDSDGFWYILGRADDIIKVSGHRIGSTEIEAAITAHPAVAEAMAIGVPDSLKGQSIVVHVILNKEYENCTRNGEGIIRLRREVIKCVENGIGRFASPKEIKFVNDLPRTPTGKTIRKIVVEKGKSEQIIFP